MLKSAGGSGGGGGGGAAWTTVLATINGGTDLNTWAPAGLEPGIMLVLDLSAANRTINGIDPTSFVDGDSIILVNADANGVTLTLADENAGGPATGKILGRNTASGNVQLGFKHSVLLVYDGVSATNGFRVMGKYPA
jgi:hypothetical protein